MLPSKSSIAKLPEDCVALEFYNILTIYYDKFLNKGKDV